MKNMKHAVANYLRKRGKAETFLYKLLLLGNNILFHNKERKTKKYYGDKHDKEIFYVVRVNSSEIGLISLFMTVLKEIAYALEKGYIPFVDLQNNITQYTTGELINGTKNAWEYFWKQPCEYAIEEIYQSKNVILSGKNQKADKEKKQCKIIKLINEYDLANDEDTHNLYCFIEKHIIIQPYIYEKVNQIWNDRFKEEKVIGVFVRGTDYVAFRPKGHPIQPTKEYIYEQLTKFRKKYPNTRIFLVTEDDIIYQFFAENLKDSLIEMEDIRFPQYKNDDYLYKYCNNHNYEIGLWYLIKLLLLAKCDYFISSITNGSKFANIMNDNHYKERIVIDLGVYE